MKAATGADYVVFPAYAGMFLAYSCPRNPGGCFPRIRGDVPVLLLLSTSSPAFSPHTRGCSLYGLDTPGLSGVFPAYAGMFLAYSCPRNPGGCFPRIRGDVPVLLLLSTSSPAFSPHTRGCSLYGLDTPGLSGVFPAYAGMFLPGSRGQGR